jgi:hypothetical protein
MPLLYDPSSGTWSGFTNGSITGGKISCVGPGDWRLDNFRVCGGLTSTVQWGTLGAGGGAICSPFTLQFLVNPAPAGSCGSALATAVVQF